MDKEKAEEYVDNTIGRAEFNKLIQKAKNNKIPEKLKEKELTDEQVEKIIQALNMVSPEPEEKVRERFKQGMEDKRDEIE